MVAWGFGVAVIIGRSLIPWQPTFGAILLLGILAAVEWLLVVREIRSLVVEISRRKRAADHDSNA